MEEEAKGFFKQHGKWILIGGIALALIVVLMKRGGSVSSAPSTPSGNTGVGSDALSGVAAAINAQAESTRQGLAALSALIVDQKKTTPTTPTTPAPKPPKVPTVPTDRIVSDPFPSNPVKKSPVPVVVPDVKKEIEKVTSPEALTPVLFTPFSASLKTWVDGVGYTDSRVWVANEADKAVLDAKRTYLDAESKGDKDAMQRAKDAADAVRQSQGNSLSDWAQGSAPVTTPGTPPPTTPASGGSGGGGSKAKII